MSVTLGQGFRPYLLRAANSIFGDAAYPGYKLDPQGFLNLLQSQNKPQVLTLNNAAGHKNTVQVSYKQRFTKDFTDTSKSCDVTSVLSRQEASVDLSSTRQIAIYLADETVAQFEDEASRTVAVGQPAGQIAAELLDDILHAANAILQGVNDDLLTLAVAAIGKNRVTGSAAAKTLNVPLNTTNLPLNAGMNEILSDYKINGGKGRPQIVGSGLMHNFMLMQAAKGMDQSGLDTKIQGAGADFYLDLSASSILGANQVIAYEPNAVQIVEYMEYTGFKAGVKPGSSEFGVIALPAVASDGSLLPVKFDWQLKYIDCPTTLTDAYSGQSATYQKGWSFIMKKDFGLFQLPSDSYRQEDGNYSVNGALRYNVTNSCDTCS